MADIPQENFAEDSAVKVGASGIFKVWLDGGFARVLIVWAIIAALALVAALLAHTFWRPILTTPDQRALFLAATTLLWLPLLLLLRDSYETIALGPKLTLPIATLIILAGLATITVVPQGRNLLWREDAGLVVPAAVAFMSFLILALVPQIANATRFARFKRDEIAARAQMYLPSHTGTDSDDLDDRRREHQDAEAVGALAATIAVTMICVLAYAAGLWSNQGLGNAAGMGIAAATVAIFACLIFLDRLPDFPPVRFVQGLSRGAAAKFGWLSRLYLGVDMCLVRIGAHVAGMEHRSARARYFLLAASETCLCIMAWFLPAPLGLAPATMGFLIALSISRLWAWVEDDRALAVITKFSPKAPLRVGFREDFRDETLLGFIFVLALIPIALMQAHVSEIFGGPLFVTPGQSDVQAWIGYLGFELAKALPVVDWADIYGLSEGSDVLKATRPIGMHAVFAARVMVDLVLISALLQALSISARNRQQKALYALDQIDRVDEIIERRELSRIVSCKKDEWFSRKDVINFARYEPGRLNEIRNTTHDPRIREFVGTILSKSANALEHAMEVLARLAVRNASATELSDAFSAVKREHAEGRTASALDLAEVLESLRGVEGLRDLKHDILNFAAQLRPASETAELLDLVIFGKGRDKFQYTRLHAAQVLAAISVHLNDPEPLRALLERLNESQRDTFGAREFVPNTLRRALKERLKELG